MLKTRIVVALYSVLVGCGIIIVWCIYFAAGSVLGIKPQGFGLRFHIAAEFMTGALMIVSGAGLWTGKKWALKLYPLSMGMLLYALVNSPGYYAGTGGVIMPVVFGTSFVFALVFVVLGFGLQEKK